MMENYVSFQQYTKYQMRIPSHTLGNGADGRLSLFWLDTLLDSFKNEVRFHILESKFAYMTGEALQNDNFLQRIHGKLH